MEIQMIYSHIAILNVLKLPKKKSHTEEFKIRAKISFMVRNNTDIQVLNAGQKIS